METEVIQPSPGLASDSTALPTTPAAIDVSPGITLHPQEIISGIRMEFIQVIIRASILRIVFRNYKNLKVAYKIVKAFNRIRRKVLGDKRIRKIACIDGKYYWDLYTPGYGSKAFENFFQGEANRVVPMYKNTNRFTNIFIAFTKKCPLQCEHCFEWDTLNARETLTLSAIKNIVLKFQNKGTAQIQLTGGEPLLRVNDIVEILKSSRPETEFWILTSGVNLTSENAKKLKLAGLTGMVISLDHFDPSLHNQFRGFKKSFEWVQTAVKNSIAANLVTALSICVTKSFVSESNLMRYAVLAKEMGVSFIQILEPRAVGHYKGMDVSLKKEHEDILEDFYFKINYDKKYSQYPIITYHGYHQRQIGCFGSGNRNLYVDTDGELHACPFCQTKMGNALSNDLDNSIENLQTIGCHYFKTFSD